MTDDTEPKEESREQGVLPVMTYSTGTGFLDVKRDHKVHREVSGFFKYLQFMILFRACVLW